VWSSSAHRHWFGRAEGYEAHACFSLHISQIRWHFFVRLNWQIYAPLALCQFGSKSASESIFCAGTGRSSSPIFRGHKQPPLAFIHNEADMTFATQSPPTWQRIRAALATLMLVVGTVGTPTHSAAQVASSSLVYVGTDGGQIAAMRFDAGTGKLTGLGVSADLAKPRWAVPHPSLPVLYVAAENAAKDGTVVAYSVNRATGALSKINEVLAGGAGTTHLGLDAPSMTLFAANFGGGTTSSIAIKQDGSLDALVSTVKSVGTGPHRRQTSPHAHGVAVDPSGRYALVADMGADRVFVFGFDRATHTLRADDAATARAWVAPAGSGPRHYVFAADGRFVYLLSELTAELTSLRWDAQSGRLTPVQTLPLSSAGFQGAKSGSEIVISPDGRYVYVGNRGESELMVYRVNAQSGELDLTQRTSAGGGLPWAFALHSSGKWLLVANQRSDKVNVFSVDVATGKLTDTGQSFDSPVPLSITFVE
jgi:6-phosphogluconolactonase